MAYVNNLVTRYELEQSKVSATTNGSAAQSVFRRSLMLYGRAMAGPDVLYRLGFLDPQQFARWHNSLTGTVVGRDHVHQLTPIKTSSDAADYIRTHMELLKERRQATVVRGVMSVQDQKHAYRVWLVHLGQVCEAVALLLRQRFLDEAGYQRYYDEAMKTLVPTVDRSLFR